MKTANITVVGGDTLNENERRALGGFFVEAPHSERALKLVQVEVPVGCQRVAEAFDDSIETDRSLSDILSRRSQSDNPEGFPDEKELARRYGSRMVSYTAKIDAIIVTTETIWVIEVKTRNQCIEGIHDAYEGFGQVLMNCDRFAEDYPTVAQEREVKGILLAEDSEVDTELLSPSFERCGVSVFDPRRGGFLIRS